MLIEHHGTLKTLVNICVTVAAFLRLVFTSDGVRFRVIATVARVVRALMTK